MHAATPGRTSLLAELATVTAALLAASHLLFFLRGAPVVGGMTAAAVAVAFLYTPIIVLWARGRPLDFLDRSLAGYLRSLGIFAVAAAVVFPPFLVAAFGWQAIVLKNPTFHAAGFPNFLSVLAAQLVLVALPEEFYFRGYLQSTLDLIFPRRWRFLGARLGWGWLITAAVFAFAHSVVFYRWWHFAIFFPALLFGFLRARTGSITAPVLFHTAANLLMDWFVRSTSS